MYTAEDNKVIFVSRNGDRETVAFCQDAMLAAKLMDRAQYLNDVKRQYTASARLFYQAEHLPNFEWTERP